MTKSEYYNKIEKISEELEKKIKTIDDFKRTYRFSEITKNFSFIKKAIEIEFGIVEENKKHLIIDDILENLAFRKNCIDVFDLNFKINFAGSKVSLSNEIEEIGIYDEKIIKKEIFKKYPFLYFKKFSEYEANKNDCKIYSDLENYISYYLDELKYPVLEIPNEIVYEMTPEEKEREREVIEYLKNWKRKTPNRLSADFYSH